MIKLNNVVFRYSKKDKNILDGVDACFEKGYLYAITGSSGAGKTTLLFTISGIERQQSGNVLIDGTEVDGGSIRRNRIAFVFQDYLLFPYMNAVDNIIAALDIHDPQNSNKIKVASDLLNELGIHDKEQVRKVKKLSGGEQQRVAIARALAIHSEYILADEPTGNLDDSTAKHIISIMKDIAHRENVCVIVVTHSEYVRKMADVSYELSNGHLHLLEK